MSGGKIKSSEVGGSEAKKNEVKDCGRESSEVEESETEGNETEESDHFEDCNQILESTPIFSCKSDQSQLRIPSDHQLLPLVHTPVTGHKRACLRNKTGPGNR